MTGTKACADRWANISSHEDRHDPDHRHPQARRPGNAVKDPDDWTTGDEAMTGAQASYLKTLCEEAGESFDPDLTKAEASKRIDALQSETGRGA